MPRREQRRSWGGHYDTPQGVQCSRETKNEKNDVQGVDIMLNTVLYCCRKEIRLWIRRSWKEA